jgi:tetratricopeptide (TPR) repeat protein
LATGYNEDGTELATKFNIIPEQAAGGLWTTPSEVCKFIIETQLALEGKSSKVLSPEMTRLQLTPTVDAVSALGIFIDKRGETKYFTHDARNYGYSGVYYGSMEGGKGVAVFINSDNVNLLPEIANSVATVYKWKDFYNPVYRNEITVPESLLEKYPGIYLFEGKLASVFKKQDGYYYWTDGMSSKMHFSTEQEFFNQEFRADKTFITDTAGHVTGFKRKVGDKEYPIAVKITNVDTLYAPIDQINALAWHLLENKKFDQAINYLKRGTTLEPNNLSIALNLAHGYLFNNEYDKAIKLYSEHLNKEVFPGYSFKDILKQDFVFFRKNGFDTAWIDKINNELKLQ